MATIPVVRISNANGKPYADALQEFYAHNPQDHAVIQHWIALYFESLTELAVESAWINA